MYTIYKFTNTYKGYQTGDDIISFGAPAMDANGGLLIKGEIYGSGYLGQIDTVPMSVLTVDVANVDIEHITDYINYTHLPTPQSNPHAGEMPSSVYYPTSVGGVPKKPIKVNLLAAVVVLGILGYVSYQLGWLSTKGAAN